MRQNLPKDCKIFKMRSFVPALKSLNKNQFWLSLATVTTYVKAFSGTTLRYIKASPKQLHAIAERIEDRPYVIGVNDCHTWFLRAVSELECYQMCVGKKYKHMVGDTLNCIIGRWTKPFMEKGGGIASAAVEAYNTGKRLLQLKENPLIVVTSGIARIINHLIKGFLEGKKVSADCIAGIVANITGMLTLGGCATKRGMVADMDEIIEEERKGNIKFCSAVIKMIGVTVGSVAYGVANTVQNVCSCFADTVCGVVSGAAGIVTGTCDTVKRSLKEGAEDNIHPVISWLTVPAIVVGSLAAGTAKTIYNAVINVCKIGKGFFAGLRSIFKGRQAIM